MLYVAIFDESTLLRHWRRQHKFTEKGSCILQGAVFSTKSGGQEFDDAKLISVYI